MHQLRCTDDRIDRAGLNAQRAADALSFLNRGNAFWCRNAKIGIERLGVAPQQRRERAHTVLTAGRTLINIRFPARDRFRVRPAAGIPATRALRLREQRFDMFDQRVPFDTKPLCGVTEQGP